MTRNDYWPSLNAWSFNGTLYAQAVATCPNGFNFACLAKGRYLRYQDSLAHNSQFYYGQKQLLLYGATAFIYEFYGSGTGSVDLATAGTFFGAVKGSNGQYTSVPERFPANWRTRKTPLSLVDINLDVLNMYLAYPVAFGGATGKGGFNLLNISAWQNGKLSPSISAQSLICLLYNLATEDDPGVVNEVLQLTSNVLNFVTGKLNPIFGPFGCTLTGAQ
jgi:hypothetical protein